jgi:hypothetical protein
MATLYEIKRASPADISFVANLLNGSPETGVDAVERLLETCAVSDIWAARHRGTGAITVLWGLARLDKDQPAIGTYWMLALDPLDTQLQEVVTLSHLVVVDMLDQCKLLENYIDATSYESVQLLKALGFSIGPAELDEGSGRVLHYASLHRTGPANMTMSLLPN